MMTVGELIEHLGQYPSELRVVVDGYEDGFDDLSPKRIRVVNIELNTGGEWFYGRHGSVAAKKGVEYERADVLALMRTADHEDFEALE